LPFEASRAMRCQRRAEAVGGYALDRFALAIGALQGSRVVRQ
jgi:hypothetical protein